MKKINYRRFSLALFIIFITILVFTAIDYYVHTLSEEYSVPGYYFTNKIIFGTIIAFITYYFIRKKIFWQKSLIISIVTSVLLQVRYYLEGYPKDFVFEFLLFHFLMLLAASMIVFYIFRRKI